MADGMGMMDNLNLLAVGGGAVAGFIFGAGWYTVLGKPWMAAAGLDPETTKPGAGPMITAAIAQLVIAVVMAGVMFHADGLSLGGGLTCAALIWAGFVATTMTVNHRFQGKPWSLTIIDGGHWLGVLLVQGAVIGTAS